MYYNRPVPGRAYRPFATEMVSVPTEDIPSWNFKKLVRWNRKEFAIYSNAQGGEIMQSLQAIRFVRCKPGEENINAKLTDAQGIEIFKRAVDVESPEILAEEFGIAKRTVSDIKNFRVRAGISLDYLNGKSKRNPTKALVATRNKGCKLSPSLASFIRKDSQVQRLDTAQLAKKYCVSRRTIQRILKGEMYSS